MALVHKGFSTFRPLAALSAHFPETASSQKFEPSRRQIRQTVVAAGVGFAGQFGHPHDSEYRFSRSRQRALQGLPGSVFDARYKGLTAHAAYLDAAICRAGRLR